MEKDELQSTKLQGVTLPKFWAWASSHCCAKVNLLNGMYVWAQLDLGQHLLLPAQTPSEPLSAVALAQLDQADKGFGPKTLACKHTLHIDVA